MNPFYRTYRRSPTRPWAPLSPAELNALAPYFVHRGSGRPMADIRARLDAIFWVICQNGPWKNLPEDMGPADTAHRQFRRWVHKGVWEKLLRDASAPGAPPELKRLEHWFCRAWRRATRILGLKAVVIARRLGLESALKGPPWMLPDPDLSEWLRPFVLQGIERAMAMGGRPEILPILDAAKAYHQLSAGHRWVPSWLAPP